MTGPLTASASSSKNTFLDLVGGDENYVVERSETDEGGEANFFVRAVEDLITVTRKFCRNRVEDTAPCQFAG